ncbi:hypothetical protein [Cupriavidus agavae]|uniref:Uncharacterized protein n=1 Tax=Cupriavidus agavae TaxID=1001822 RepID=A0A4Q7RSW2_9BURK|nr:hypothetical protein [Cupriavidus agavae]RZT36694.1 hypothetical protein EV147_3357 [Cupriavidus agavae]
MTYRLKHWLFAGLGCWLLVPAAQAQDQKVQPGQRDPYTQGARSGARDPYTDGAKSGKFDSYTDGARQSTTRTDLAPPQNAEGGRVNRPRNPYFDGGRTEPRDPYTDGARKP